MYNDLQQVVIEVMVLQKYSKIWNSLKTPPPSTKKLNSPNVNFLDTKISIIKIIKLY